MVCGHQYRHEGTDADAAPCGQLESRNANFEGTLRIGYFNTANPGSNFIGIETSEPAGTELNPSVQHTGQLFRAYLSVKGPDGTISTVPMELHMIGGHPKTFDLIWKGNPDGSGTLSGTIISLPISITVAAGSGSFDAFSILAGGDSSDDSTKKTDVCYFGNLVYDK